MDVAKSNRVIKRYICDCGKECFQRQSLHIHKQTCGFIKNLNEFKSTLSLYNEEILNILNENENLNNIIIKQNEMIAEQNKIIAELSKQGCKI